MNGKENFLSILRGEQPEWVPKYAFGSPGGAGAPTAMVSTSLFFQQYRSPGKVKDCWGVTYVPADEAGSKLPEPDNFILRDIRKWRDVIKLPDISSIDFEEEARKNLEKIDRKETAVLYDLNASTFQLLVSFMGFSEALCAMYEEPDEVKALFEFIGDFLAGINEKCINYYQPDALCLVDDTATWQNPFFSLEMYRELIKPYHMRQTKIGTERGLGVDVHNCGRCEDLIDDWLEMGVVCWNPAQTSNDLVAIKKKYGNKLVLAGCWDARDALLDPNITEEAVKQSVYNAIDTFAPGGGYMFMGGYLGAGNNPEAAKKNKWIDEAATSYGKSFYK